MGHREMWFQLLVTVVGISASASTFLQTKFERRCGNDVMRASTPGSTNTIAARSRTKCAALCAVAGNCMAFNFNSGNGQASCETFGNVGSDVTCATVTAKSGGKYYESSEIKRCANGGTWDGTQCLCTGSWIKPRCDTVARDCSELADDGRTSPGQFSTWDIQPDGALVPFPVYCYLPYGGWTIFQRREMTLGAHCTGRENFERSWQDYKDGFGDFGCDFWLGNDKIHQLTSQKRYKLDILLIPDTATWTTYQGYYDDFAVGNASTQYRATVGQYEGAGHTTHIGDSLTPAAHPQYNINNMPFSTHDRDNDMSAQNCAVDFKSGWWFNDCTAVNVNGVYTLKADRTRDTTVPSIMWKYDWDNTGIRGIDLKVLAI